MSKVVKTKSSKSIQSFKVKNTSCVLSYSAQKDAKGGCCGNGDNPPPPPPPCGTVGGPAC